MSAYELTPSEDAMTAREVIDGARERFVHVATIGEGAVRRLIANVRSFAQEKNAEGFTALAKKSDGEKDKGDNAETDWRLQDTDPSIANHDSANCRACQDGICSAGARQRDSRRNS